MALNLTKIKDEAKKDKDQEEQNRQNIAKIISGVSQHREDLKNWFISLFPDEKIENNGYTEFNVLFDGGTKVSLVLELITKTSKGGMAQINDRNDFSFKKTKNGNLVASCTFIDETDYLNLDTGSKNYKYTYATQKENRIFTFSDLEQFVQYVVNNIKALT
ncbi:hypothetical protein IDM33_12890 [Acinetobacter seifertii]|nr:hypothetical protein [Acinetobacter seifertii]